MNLSRLMFSGYDQRSATMLLKFRANGVKPMLRRGRQHRRPTQSNFRSQRTREKPNVTRAQRQTVIGRCAGYGWRAISPKRNSSTCSA